MIEEVKFKCPVCGNEWTEKQDENDNWFKLGTTKTLCSLCSKNAINKLKVKASIAEKYPWILDRETLCDEIITKADEKEIHTYVYYTDEKTVSYNAIDEG